MPKITRVRFAPSPTGFLHLGGLRSALFNYLYAQHNHGQFILRIEDTDRERLVPGASQQIQDSLSWLGLDWDEGINKPGGHGPYLQSERLGLYQKYAGELVAAKKAYYDYTPPERLAELRAEAAKAKRPFLFNKSMATLNPPNSEAQGVIRLEVTAGPEVSWEDLVWGQQGWKREVLDDFVMIKSDGYPTYNFAVVVDDHLMEISEVFRGSEFLPTTPKNLLVYEALGWKPPRFAHLPPVLGKDKAKLSKRHGAKSALEYRDAGYLPEAVINYLASLGFNDGSTQDIYSLNELIKAFEPTRVQSSPAIFDAERLDWTNGVYIRRLELDDLIKRCEGFWPASARSADKQYLRAVLALVQERLKFLAELPELTEFFFADPTVNEDLMPRQVDPNKRTELLSKIINSLNDSDFSESDLESRLRGLSESEDIKPGHLFSLIRVAVTGSKASPGLFETLHVLGKATSLRRLRRNIKT